MRLILVLVIATLVAGCGTQTFIVRAPLDGYVNVVQAPGTVLAATSSKAQGLFDSIRVTTGAPTLYNVHARREYADDSLLFLVTSDLLELQLQQEKSRLRLASQKLALAKSALELEARLKSTDRDRETGRRDYNQWRVEAEVRVQGQKPRDCKTCLGPGLAGWLNQGKEAAAKEHEGFVQRQDYQLESDMPRRLAIAQGELDAANMSVRIIEANIAVGKVVCPQKCRVKRALAMSGQYVTRGDPIAEVELVE